MPRYPQSNGQIDVTNKTLLNYLKKWLEGVKDKWVNELPGILWAYRTTNRWPTRVTLFALAYSMEVIIPTEIGLPMVRIIVQELEINEGNLEIHLD